MGFRPLLDDRVRLHWSSWLVPVAVAFRGWSRVCEKTTGTSTILSGCQERKMRTNSFLGLPRKSCSPIPGIQGHSG
jgi:hypothetical protein